MSWHGAENLRNSVHCEAVNRRWNILEQKLAVQETCYCRNFASEIAVNDYIFQRETSGLCGRMSTAYSFILSGPECSDLSSSFYY